MFCSNCGKEIDDTSKFCRYCGVIIENISNETIKKSIPPKIYHHSYPIPAMVSPDLHDRSEEFYFENRPNILCFNFGIWFLCSFLFIISLYCILVDYALLILSLFIIFIIFILVLISIIRWRHTIYALTTKRVLRISGIIGKDVYENKLNRVQDIRLRIGIFQRIIGCGDITITTAGTAGIECVWRGIKEPKKIQKLLRDVTA